MMVTFSSKHTDEQTDGLRQEGGQTDRLRQEGGQTDGQTDSETDRHLILTSAFLGY